MADDLKGKVNEGIQEAAKIRKGIMGWADRIGTNWLAAAAILGWLVAIGALVALKFS